MPSVTAFAGTGANIAGGNFNWINPGNIVSDNGSNATVTGPRNTSGVTNGLRGTNFGFSIPSGSTIDGIVFEVQWSATYTPPDSDVTLSAIQMVKAGTLVGNTVSGGNIPTTLTTDTYGTSTDLWGTTWTVSDINGSTFGVQVVLAMDETVNGTRPTALVDYFKLTVHYTASATATGNMFLVF